MYKSCCILISSLYSNSKNSKRIMWVSNFMRSSKIGLWCLGYQSSRKLRTVNLKDFKNLTFDKSFFFLMQLDEWMLSIGDITSLIKNALFLYVRSAPFNTSTFSCSRCHRRTCNLTMISSLRKSSNQFWSTTCIIRSVMLRSANKWFARVFSISYIPRQKFVLCDICRGCTRPQSHYTLRG